jgi:hypothetical protein
MSDYAQGAVSISAIATLVCQVGPENDGVLVNNSGSATVYLGGRSVTASGAAQGIPLLANATITVPSLGSVTHSLYAITASGTSTVSYLYPAL